MELSQAFKRFRALKNVPQTQMAAVAGVSVTQYQNYEYGKSEPTASVLIALAEHYCVSLDYLCGLSDDPSRH